jgi:hypothetical protein
VNLTQGLKKGSGDHLLYDNIKDEVTLTSDPGSFVSTYDPSQGSANNATKASWIGAGGKIHFENDRGGRVQSITK